ncbi:hypothetical protein Y032_0248g98 [Ancylostoma ceylanicum]|nr:hypothetical protein Y032_0248g98 [Ancylostoma ceylanicum]
MPETALGSSGPRPPLSPSTMDPECKNERTHTEFISEHSSFNRCQSSTTMVKDLSPAQLSALWLLHDRHTTRHAVEKAIELGLPLWKEAVHLARACHRSNMDLAGGAYYVVGSDFIDNEDSSQYAYHELGRYPDVIACDLSQNHQSERLNCDISAGCLLYPSTSREELAHSSASISVDDATNPFESDRNKHIQLLLGGVSSTELENFQSEKSSLEICEISDDNESICTRSCVEASTTPISEEANDAANGSSVMKENESQSVQLVSEKSRSQDETTAPHAGSTLGRKPSGSESEEDRYDFSKLDAQMPRFCEVPSTLPTRSLKLMDRTEFERRLMSELEQQREEKHSSIRSKSPSGDSEAEGSHHSGAMEIDDAVSQLAPDMEMNEVISKLMKEDVAAEFSDAGTPSKKSKRHYVEPFDGDSSIAGSEFSDTNIDVNILYEISELRREEGASSPSSCSIDSGDVMPPDVCVWHPQSYTYNIDLITYFRSPSPLEEAVAVIAPKDYVELTVVAPKYEEVSTKVELAKKLPHSGAFARKRGGRCVEVSFNISASKDETSTLDCNINNPKQECEFSQTEHAVCCLEEAALNVEAPKDESCLLECHVNNINHASEHCEVVHVDSHHKCISLDTQGAKEESCLLGCQFTNGKDENWGCTIEREDHHSSTSYLETNASTTESCGLHVDVHSDRHASEKCEVKSKEPRVEIASFNTKAATLVEVNAVKSYKSEPSSKDCAFTHVDHLHSSASVSCKAPAFNHVDTSQALRNNIHNTEVCSAILTDVFRANTSFSCSVPKYENISSYWVLDILLGNSAVIVLKDKSIRKATYYCKAHDGHGKRKSPTVDDLARTRKRDDSLNEVLLLLEAGAMPSQYIEASPPRPPPLSKGKGRTRSHDVKGRMAPSTSSKCDTSNLQAQEELVTSSKIGYEIKTRQSSKSERASVPRPEDKLERSSVPRPESNLERSSVPPSEGSDLSASPDRLVICEDEDIIVQDDPVEVIQNLQDTSHAVANVLPERITPSIQTVPSVVETNIVEQGPSGAAEVVPNRRSLRKRVSEPVEAPVARKRSAKGHSEIKSTVSVAEEKRKVGEPKPLHQKLSIPEDSPVNVRDKVSRRMGRLSEAHTATPPPSTISPISNVVRKTGQVTRSPVTFERKRAQAQPSPAGPQEYVFREPIKDSLSKVAVVKRSAGDALTKTATKIEPKQHRKLEKSAPQTAQTSRDPGSSTTLIPPQISIAKIAKKPTSPVIEVRKELFTESSAAFVSIPCKASVGVQFTISSAESTSLSCHASPTKDARTFEQFDDTDTGLDILAEVAVSAAPHFCSPSVLESSTVDTVLSPAATTFRKGRRKTSAVEILPPRAAKALPEVETTTTVHHDKGTSSKVDVTLAKKHNLVTATESAGERTCEKKRQARSLPEPELLHHRPKRQKTNVEKAGAQKELSASRGAARPATTGRNRQGEQDSTRAQKRRIIIATERIDSSCAQVEDGVEAVIPTRLQSQTDTTPKPCKRRRTTEPEKSLPSGGRYPETTRAKVPAVMQLDKDVAPIAGKRTKIGGSIPREENAAVIVDTNQEIPTRKKSGRLSASQRISTSQNEAESRRRTTAACSSVPNVGSDDEVMFVESGFSRRRRKSLTPPILVVAVEVTSSFVPVKRDNNRSAEPITLPTYNVGEPVSLAVYSSDSAEVLNALALDIIIGEASALSAVNLATFAQFVLNLFDPVMPIFAPLADVEPSTLPANFTTIFERSTPLQFRHRLDYNSFNSMLLNRLPENGLHALTLDLRKVSMLKITKFVDTVKEAVEEICEELRTRKTLSKAEIKREIDLSGEVQQLITSRYVESMMKMADACSEARDVPTHVIADRFHLLLCGWTCFLQQGGVLRVRLQLCPGRSHPGIVDITTAWLDQIDTVLSRAQATKSMRTSAFAVSLAQEKTIVSKVWYQMASHTSTSCEDGSYIFCEECKLYFRNEDTDFIHNRVFHQKSRECEECYDMFHTLLGLDLHMVGSHKRNFAADL